MKLRKRALTFLQAAITHCKRDPRSLRHRRLETMGKEGTYCLPIFFPLLLVPQQYIFLLDILFPAFYAKAAMKLSGALHKGKRRECHAEPTAGVSANSCRPRPTEHRGVLDFFKTGETCSSIYQAFMEARRRWSHMACAEGELEMKSYIPREEKNKLPDVVINPFWSYDSCRDHFVLQKISDIKKYICFWRRECQQCQTQNLSTLCGRKLWLFMKFHKCPCIASYLG